MFILSNLPKDLRTAILLKVTLDVLLVGDFLSAGVGLMWTLSSSSLVPSFSSFGSSMSADSDFLGTKIRIQLNSDTA